MKVKHLLGTASGCPSPGQIPSLIFTSVPVEPGALKEVILWQSTDWTELTVSLSPNLGPECYFGGPLLYIDIESNWEDMVARSLETPATWNHRKDDNDKGERSLYFFFNWSCKTNLALCSFLCSKWEQTVYCLEATALTWAVPVCIMRLGLPFMRFDWSVLRAHGLFCILNVIPGFSRRKNNVIKTELLS